MSSVLINTLNVLFVVFSTKMPRTMMMQGMIRFFILLIFVTQLAWGEGSMERQFGRNKDVAQLANKEFFGDFSQEQTQNPGLLDYSNPDLDHVRNAVESGDIEVIGKALKEYYQKQQEPAPPHPENEFEKDYTYYTAQAALDWRFTVGLGERCVGEILLSSEAQRQWSNDVLFSLTEEDVSKGRLSFILYNSIKESGRGVMDSREGNQPPMLRIRYTNGRSQEFIPLADTTINSRNRRRNYGDAPILTVADAHRSNQRGRAKIQKSYILFDISELDLERIKDIKLGLYGFSEESPNRRIALYKTGERSWDERSLVWKNHGSKTYGWGGPLGSMDWLKMPQPSDADGEYRWQIPRFYFMESLLTMYQRSGEERYAQTAVDLLLSCINTVDQAYNQFRGGSAAYPRSLDVVSRLMQSIQALRVLSTSPSMPPMATIEIAKSVERMSHYLTDGYGKEGFYHPDGNWGIYESTILIKSSLASPELKASQERYNLGIQRINNLFSKLIDTEGAYKESTSGYTFGIANSAITIAEIIQAGGKEMEPEFKRTLLRLGYYCINLMYPNGYEVNWGDSGGAYQRPIILRYGRLLQDDGLLFIGSGGTEGVAPTSTLALFREGGGIGAIRTGWEEQDAFFFLQSSRSGFHKHLDDLSLCFYALGAPLLMDPGVFSYTNDPSSRWQRSTAGHNTVTVDGKDNWKFGGRLLRESTGAGLEVLGLSTNEKTPWTHHRTALITPGGYGVVQDQVSTKNGSHEVRVHWRPSPSLTMQKNSQGLMAKSSTPNAPSLKILSSKPVETELGAGYYSPHFYEVEPLSIGDFIWRGRGEVEFQTLLYPYYGNDVAIKVEPLDVTGPEGTMALSIVGEEFKDILILAAPGKSHEPIRMENMSFTGTALWLRWDSKGELQKGAFHHLSQLEGSTLPSYINANPLSSITLNEHGEYLP